MDGYKWSTLDREIDKKQKKKKKSYENRSFRWDRPENGQGHILFPGAVLAHAYAKARTEKQLSRGHQVALLRGFKLQHRRVPDESMQLAVGAGEGKGREGRTRRKEGGGGGGEGGGYGATVQ